MEATRYNLLEESNVYDIDNESFPDVLSFNYREILEDKTNFSTPPLVLEVPNDFVASYFYYIYNMYPDICLSNSKVYLDDILLNLNNIAYRNNIKENDKFYFFTKEDLLDFLRRYSRG